jgi:hypothetical protein
MFPYIYYVPQLRSHARASNRAGAWTCEVMQCMLVFTKSIIPSQVHAPARLLVRMAASII